MNIAQALTTDHSSELAELFESLENIAASGQPTRVVLARHFSVAADSSQWFSILNAIATRIDNLRDFYQTVDDKFVRPNMRQAGIDALNTLETLLSTRSLNDTWQNSRTVPTNPSSLSSLEAFSEVSHRHRPLKKLSPEERDEAITKISDLIAEFEQLRNEGEQIDWQLHSIYQGLKTTLFILCHFEAFGHDASIEALLSLSTKAKCLFFANCNGNFNHSYSKESKFSFLKNVARTSLFALELFIVPYETGQAYEYYLSNYTEDINKTIQIMDQKQGQKALPAPGESALRLESDYGDKA